MLSKQGKQDGLERIDGWHLHAATEEKGYGLGVEYKKSSLGKKGGWSVRMTVSLPSVSRCQENVGASTAYCKGSVTFTNKSGFMSDFNSPLSL
jgi:hypothetical protein